jgi:hypothetical protein
MPASKSSKKTLKKPVKTSKASSSKRPRASSASDADIPKKKYKRKPADDTSEDEETSSSPVRPHRKETKVKRKAKAKVKPKAGRPAVPVVEEVEEDDVQMVSEPEVVVEEESDKNSQVSVSFQLDSKEGTYFSKDLSDRHVAEVQERLSTKAETARDVDLIFTKRVQVVFTTPNGKSETRDGRWCILCK